MIKFEKIKKDTYVVFLKKRVLCHGNLKKCAMYLVDNEQSINKQIISKFEI